MVKPRGKVTRSNTPRATPEYIVEPTIRVATWCPDKEAKEPPEQVHFIIEIPGLERVPIVMRYKSPDTLGFFIEELTSYRREVWHDCEPVKGEK